MTRHGAVAAVLLLVVSLVGATAGAAATTTTGGTASAGTASTAGAAAATAQSGSAYQGTHVTFSAQGDAVTDYAVDGTTILEGVAVQSASRVESAGGFGANVDLRTVTSFGAAGLSLAAQSSTNATVRANSGARLRAHDNYRGVVVVSADGKSQYVRANLSGDSEAEQAGERRVVVTAGDGSRGAFVLVGDGSLAVNRAGNVTARLGNDARLVYRQYDGERTEGEKRQEELIADGTAAAEVYLQAAEDGGQSGGEYAADVVSYGQGTTVRVTESAKNRLVMTAERSRSRGKVVIASLAEGAFDAPQDVAVTVDGEACVRASSYGELRQATRGGDSSKFLVRSSQRASAAADVAIAVDHFSTREIAVAPGDGGDGGQKSPAATDGSGPGFGALAAVAALAGALLALRRR